MRYWRRNTVWRSAVVWLVCLQLVTSPLLVYAPAFADEVIDEANKGQDTALNLLLDYQVPSLSDAPPGDPLGPNQLNMQELFPGYDPTDPSQFSDLSDLMSNPSDLSTQGVAQQFSLQGGNDETSEAYQTIGDGASNPHAGSIDMRNDSFLDISREIISGTHPMLDEILTACAEDVTAGDPGTDTVTRLQDIWTCSQAPSGTSGQCTVTRDYVLLPVASQTILTVAGGACTPSIGGSGKDRSDWLAEWGGTVSLQWSPASGPAQYCRTTGGSPDGAHFMTSVRRGLSVFYHFPYFCGEFDDAVPTVTECEIIGRRQEHACRNAPPTAVGGSDILIRQSSVIPGPTGECSSYSPSLPGSFDGTVDVDYTGCDADRQNYCGQINDYYVAECTNAEGDDCGVTCGSGADINVWAADSWYGDPDGYAPAQVCRRNVTGSITDVGQFVRTWEANIRGGASWYFAPTFCGDFTVTTPTAGECDIEATRLEKICRNAPNGSLNGFDGAELNPSRGPTGSCGTYQFQYSGNYDGTTPVDYTGCDADRISYCQTVRADFTNECNGECNGTVCTDGGEDISDWQALYGTAMQPGSASATEYCISSTNNASTPRNDWYMHFYDTISGIYDHHYGLFCGEFDTEIPTEEACRITGGQLEWACANADSAGDGWYLNPLHPTAGPIGDCIYYNEYLGLGSYDGTVPVDYSACGANRSNYCQAFRAAYEAECMDAPVCTGGGCESEDNIAVYNYGSVYDNAGPLKRCLTTRFDYGVATPPPLSALDHNGRTFSYYQRTQLDPGNYSLYGYPSKVCGDSGPGDCAAMTAEFELDCNTEPVGPPTRYYPGGVPPDIPAYCAAEAAAFEASCQAANACLAGGTGSGALLNGTETITSPGLGPGFLEILADQNVFGTTVDFEETAFNPSDYGLVAGQYVISDHTVAGNGIDSWTIDDQGSYGSNWDYTTTITATDSDGFTVDATLYEIVQNGFAFSGCSQQDVQNVTSGQCTGSVTCTDYTPPCRIVDGVTLCESVSPSDGITETLSPWSTFTNGIPEMCWEADVEILDCVISAECINNPSCVDSCDHLPSELQAECLAEPCWIDAQGNQVCLDSTSESWTDNLGEPGWVDDCQDLVDDPACELLPDIACIEGMESDTDPTNIDLCELRQRFFDCGSDVTTPGVPGADDVDVTCGAQIRCFGDECANTQVESNPDFVKAAVAATTVTESTKDMTCDVENDPTSCRLFDGTREQCKDPRGSWLGIIPDCCDESRKAGGQYGDFIQYMQLVRYSFRLARDPMVASFLATRGLGFSSGVESVVNFPADVGRAAGQVVTNGFNSALKWAGFDGVKIAEETVDEATNILSSTTGFGPIQQYIATGVYNFMSSIGATEFADSLFQASPDGTVTDWAADGLGEMVGNVVGVLMTIYTIYSIVKILGNLIFSCEEEELAFGVQQVNRACHHVGTYCHKRVNFGLFKKCVIEMQTYCCFSSPFARILNEQLREQGIGADWGTPTEPNCEGIAITELENVDWDLVDLSEWEAILFEAGLVPDPNNPPLNFIPTDRHPGDATGGSEGMTDTDLNEQIIDLMIDTTDSGRFDLSTAPLHQPDPELMPWYDDGVP